MDSPIQIRPKSTGSCGPRIQFASGNMKTASNAEDARSMPSLITTGDYAATASHGIFWKPYLSTSLVRHTYRKVGDRTVSAKMPTSIVTAKESRAPEMPDQGPRSGRDPTEPSTHCLRRDEMNTLHQWNSCINYPQTRARERRGFRLAGLARLLVHPGCPRRLVPMRRPWGGPATASGR